MSDSSARHAISVTMTADMRQAVTEMKNVQKEIDNLVRVRAQMGKGVDTSKIDSQIASLKNGYMGIAETAGIASNTQKVTTADVKKQMDDLTQGNGKLQQAFGQAGYAVEDFFSVFDTMGARGGIRAAGNNISMMARTLAGSFTGSLIGIGVVAIPLMMKMFGEAEDSVKGFDEQVKELMTDLELYQKLISMGIEHKFAIEDIQDVESVDAAEEQLKELQRQMERTGDAGARLEEDIHAHGKAYLKAAEDGSGGFNKLAKNARKGLGDGADDFMKKFGELRNEFHKNLAANPDDVEKALGPYRRGLLELQKEVLFGKEGMKGKTEQDTKDIATVEKERRVINKMLEDQRELLAAEEDKEKFRDKAAEIHQQMVLNEKTITEELERQAELEEKKKQLKEELLELESRQRAREHQKNLMDAMSMIHDLEAKGLDKVGTALDNMDEKLNKVKGTARDVGRAFGFGSEEHERAKEASLLAQARITQSTLRSLKGMLHKVEETQRKFVRKDGQQTGPNLSEAVAAVQGLAQAQIDEAKNRKQPKKAPPQPDVVAAVDQLTNWLVQNGFKAFTEVK